MKHILSPKGFRYCSEEKGGKGDISLETFFSSLELNICEECSRQALLHSKFLMATSERDLVLAFLEASEPGTSINWEEIEKDLPDHLKEEMDESNW